MSWRDSFRALGDEGPSNMVALAAIIASIIGEAALRGSVALLVAAPFALLCRRRAAAQSLVWHVAFAGVLCLTVLSPALPSWAPPMPSAVQRIERIAAKLSPTWLSEDEGERTTIGPAPSAARGDVTVREQSLVPLRRRDIAIVAFILIWGLGVAWRVARAALERAWLRRVERDGRDVSEQLPGVTVTRRLSAIETSAVVVPMIWGLRRHRLLLPNGWRRWSKSVIDIVVRHEVAHLERHDLIAKACVEMVVSVFWFNPIVWIAARQAHLARERACDDHALRYDMTPEEYADALIKLTRLVRDSARRPRFALAVGRSGDLAARVHALLDANRSRTPLGTGHLLAGAVSGSILLAPVAVVRIAVPYPPRFMPVAASVLPTRVAVVGARGRALDSAFASLEGAGFSGVILVARDNEVVFRKAYGLADRARNIPVTVGTQFEVAGIMKAVTAAAVVDLVDRGLVSLDAPVSRYLPEIAGQPRSVTLRQLLLHTDGLNNVRHVTASRAAFLRDIADGPSAFPAGTSYSSNDAGHSLVAAVVEQVVGRPFDDFVLDRFINGAGLSATSIGRRARATTVGYVDGRDPRVPQPEHYEWGVRGSRGLLTTADDLHRWYLALSAGRIVSRRATEWLFSSHLATSKRFGQGFGWLLYDSASATAARSTPIPGRRRSGREAGFESELVHNPSGGWIAVILANTDDNALRSRVLETVGTVMSATPSN
jgi:CubicO group peptidase (beta-lactamase class C family)/beta-lactamase regulating signal transducer with metallopeptidase domain